MTNELLFQDSFRTSLEPSTKAGLSRWVEINSTLLRYVNLSQILANEK
ncbi:hypothetical protein [Coleofasciculus sp.]